MGRLQRRHRWHDVAQQGRRSGKTSTGDRADAGLSSEMVPRRQADRVLRASARRTVANLCGWGRRGRARTALSQWNESGGPRLVAGRQVAGLWREFAEQSRVRGLCPRSEDTKRLEVAGL